MKDFKERKPGKRYKRIRSGIVTSAAVVTIGAGLAVPMTVNAADVQPVHRHASLQRKAPAWRVGLKSAEAKVLGLTNEQYKEARRTKSLDQLVQEADLTFDQFSAKMKVELTAEWKARGASDKEIEARLARLAKYQDRREHRWERAIAHELSQK